ncbi:MAG TPA: glycine--tRNA ligase subunit beta [Sphingomicrobium sp.]|nr:glycine--tRNA ligase subunit beta [Sphingomicrobium sp.]
MADFLLELLSEEIPARMQAPARNDLAKMFVKELAKAGLEHDSIEVHSTPRRLVLVVRGLPLETQPSRKELKGPRVDAPPSAIDGFLRQTGFKREQLEERDGGFYAVFEKAAQPTATILRRIAEVLILQFPWPKSMRWGPGSSSTESLKWIRPLHNVLAILGAEPIGIDVSYFSNVDANKKGQTRIEHVFTGVASEIATPGHQFHHPTTVTIGGVGDYAEKMRACHVIVDQDERERMIREGAEKAAADAGLKLLCDEGLVVENAGMTEWPVALLGRFDASYLDVPREVIVLTMRTNQKYFACTNSEGELAPAFVCIANIDANDGGAAIVEGNCRVLAARLADARFFWEQDLKTRLEDQAKKLDGIVFHDKLGTVARRVERLVECAEGFCAHNTVPKQIAKSVLLVAQLAKADLVTGMVGEFPELQGIIGGHLARHERFNKRVSNAIADQYTARSSDPVAVTFNVVDRIELVTTFFAANERPTGSKDPFGLRRAALSLVRLIIESGLRTDLKAFIDFVINVLLSQVMTAVQDEIEKRYGEGPKDVESELKFRAAEGIAVYKGISFEMPETIRKGLALFGDVRPNQEKIVNDVFSFIIDRLKVQQREAGVRHDLIDAVFALGEDDIVRLLARVKALQEFVETGDGADLLVAYKRAANILKRENWTAPAIMSSADEQGIPQTGEEDPLVLVEEPGMAEAVAEMASGSAGASDPHEQALVAALEAAEPKASAALEAEDFTAAMAALASLRKPIDAFFDHVTVNDPDAAKRKRRLNMLLSFRDAVHQVADFSKIEG